MSWVQDIRVVLTPKLVMEFTVKLLTVVNYTGMQTLLNGLQKDIEIYGRFN